MNRRQTHGINGMSYRNRIKISFGLLGFWLTVRKASSKKDNGKKGSDHGGKGAVRSSYWKWRRKSNFQSDLRYLKQIL